ncbi:MAG: L-idonate 5-dehydrogenase [Alphaproteobacteria bacterium]|nr:L-idonate 5-dehydrogenase [Alphaproteobacteria bacterium]
MKACVLHAPKDLRFEEIPDDALEPGQVRVQVAAGGICGSDMHYYFHGGFGTVRIRQPMILGHEVSGTVAELGAGVSHVKIGDLVALEPGIACGTCRFCQAGQQNQCLDMRFFGSAMRLPHVQGAFRQSLVIGERQCHKVSATVTGAQAAFAEPLAVALHGMNRAGALLGKKVLVTGSGPIGALCVAAARMCGAAEIVAVDVASAPLAAARRMGADHVIDALADPDWAQRYEKDKGTFDVAFEASGNERALRSAIAAVRARGTIIVLGMGGDMTLPMGMAVPKEIELRGSFRFFEEFAWAVDCISTGRIDVLPILTDTIAASDADRAFALASDRSKAMKVHLSFA